MRTQVIYMIEVLSESHFHDEEHWIPMYQPCYSEREAKGKLKRYQKPGRPRRYRVAVYERISFVP